MFVLKLAPCGSPYQSVFRTGKLATSSHIQCPLRAGSLSRISRRGNVNTLRCVCEVPADPPVQFERWHRSHSPRAASAPYAERSDGDAVNALAVAFPPEEGHAGGERPALRHGDARVWIERQRIGRADEANRIRVGGSGKERVEGLEALVAWIPVAA